MSKEPTCVDSYSIFYVGFFSHENLLYLWTFLLIHFLGAEIVGKANERILFFLDISLCMMFFFRNLPMYELFLIFTWTTSKHRSLSNGSSLIQRINCLLLFCNCVLTLYSITSVCIFSILLSRHFLRLWQGEFVQQSRASLVIISFILMTLMFDSGVMLCGEIGS